MCLEFSRNLGKKLRFESCHQHTNGNESHDSGWNCETWVCIIRTKDCLSTAFICIRLSKHV